MLNLVLICIAIELRNIFEDLSIEVLATPEIEDFSKYKKEYERDLNDQFNEDVKKRIIASVASMMGIAITCGFDIHLAIKIILSFIGALFIIYNLNKVA